MLIEIMDERPGDVVAIRDLNQRAFEQNQEGDIVDALRSNGGALLSLVATVNGLVDEQLLLKVQALANLERGATAQLIASLAELDARRLYLAEGFPSLFSYCTEALHLSEHGAYNRIEVARAARRWPVILEKIADGAVTLTVVRLLIASLTDSNHRQLLEAATHKSKREVEQMIAALRPRPPVPSFVPKLPTSNSVAPLTSELVCAESSPSETMVKTEAPHSVPAEAPLPQRQRAVIAPLAPERYKVQMTVSRETHDKLRQVQDLLRHQVPGGDPAVVFERALTLLLKDLQRNRMADARHPRPARPSTPGSRRAPAAVTREVWKRQRAVRIRRRQTTVHRARVPRVASRHSIRRWRPDHD